VNTTLAVEAVLRIALFALAVAALPADASSTSGEDKVLSLAVIGLEQSGAASADSSQKFFFDLFQSYPLPIKTSKAGGSSWRWWANVRIASYPQQVTAGVGQFSPPIWVSVGEPSREQARRIG
jgi:hypothetical protein